MRNENNSHRVWQSAKNRYVCVCKETEDNHNNTYDNSDVSITNNYKQTVTVTNKTTTNRS